MSPLLLYLFFLFTYISINTKNILMILLMLEIMMILITFNIFFVLNSFSSNIVFIFLIIISMMVASATIALSCLTNMTRHKNSSFIKSLSIVLC